MNRRDFLVLSVSPLLLSNISKDKNLLTLGLQLYTLRDLVSKDLSITLRSLSKIGFTNLELYPFSHGNFFGLEAATCKKILSDYGMHASSMHISYSSTFDGKAARTSSFLDGYNELLDGANQLGCKYVVLPNIPREERDAVDGYMKVAEKLNKAGELALARGITFCYHNHSFEFDKPTNGDKTGYELLLENTDIKNVKFELDIFWAIKAKQDIKALFDNHPNRFPLWHVKDVGPLPNEDTYPVGQGSINWKEIFSFASKAGLQTAFVEQDNHTIGSPLVNVKQSLEFLKKL